MPGASIRGRLLMSLLPLFIAAEIATGVVSYRYVLRESHQLFDYHLQQMALSLRDQGAVMTPPVPNEEREQFDFVVQIWNADGSKVYLSQTRSRARLPDRATLGFADVVTDGERWRVFSTLARGRVIQVGQPYQVRERIAAAAAMRSLTPLLVLAPLVAIAIWWLVGRSLAPVERVASDLRRRDERRLDPVSDERLPAEIEPMVRSLNGLLGRLQQAFAAQRAFVADAAHELRTPITALKLQAGLLGRARDDAQRADALAQLHAGIDRSAHLVDQLLTLARNEPQAQTSQAANVLPSAQVDLARLARDAAAELQTIAEARGTTITVDAPQTLALRGDANALLSLVCNLLDNAIRHGAGGRRIAVSVAFADAGGIARLIVDDDGPGIAAEERERVFDRFYGRATGDDAGSGLGLAIVRAVAERHGGTVELEESPLGGLRATVDLPVLSQS